MATIELGQRERRSSSATSTDGLMAASIDMASLSKRDVSALVKDIEDTRQRLKELEAELDVSYVVVTRDDREIKTLGNNKRHVKNTGN